MPIPMTLDMVTNRPLLAAGLALLALAVVLQIRDGWRPWRRDGWRMARAGGLRRTGMVVPAVRGAGTRVVNVVSSGRSNERRELVTMVAIGAVVGGSLAWIGFEPMAHVPMAVLAAVVRAPGSDDRW